MIRADYHTHTRFSPDSRCEPEELCEAALRGGLAEIAITDHFEFFPPGNFADGRYEVSTFAARQQALAACRDKFAGRLAVRSGIEVGQPQCDPEGAAALMGALSFDYVIGSLHKMEGMDLGLIDYPEEEIPALVEEDLRMLRTLAETGDFDCMGHIDIIKRYAAVKGKRIDLLDYQDALDPVLRALVSRGKGLEINTSGLRQAARETLPSHRLLRRFRELGGEIVTIGSDAHRPEDVGAGYEAALAEAETAGFRYLALFEGRMPSFTRIDL